MKTLFTTRSAETDVLISWVPLEGPRVRLTYNLEAVQKVLEAYKNLIDTGEELYAHQQGYTPEVIEDLKAGNF